MAISKNRLKELINQKATIYTWSDRAAYEQFGMEMTFDEKVYEIELRESDKIHERFWGGAMLESTDHPIMALYTGIPLGNLFETKWEMEFGNIQRTDTLSLPSWEEFCDCKYSNEFTFFVNGFEYNLFATVRNKECGEPDTLIIGTNDLKTACGYDEIFEKAYTKENYTEACRLAKKLFLGEKECL